MADEQLQSTIDRVKHYVSNELKDKEGKPYFLDVNINCSFGDKSAIDNVPRLFGVNFEDTLFEVILSARRKKFPGITEK